MIEALNPDNQPTEAAKRFINPDPVEWILEHFRVPETPDHRLILDDYQKVCLRRALKVDDNGNYLYSVILWSDIKKSIKSTVAAAVVLWRAWQLEWGSIKIVANDLKQADSRVAMYARRAVELHPIMKDLVKIKLYNMEFPNRTKVEAIAVDPKGEAGGNDDMVVFSELWAANNKAAQRLWTEMTLSPTKYGKSFRWIETYAGYHGESPLLEGLYESGITSGRRFSWSGRFDPPLNVYENPSARLFVLWNQDPRLPWQTPEYYAQEAAVLHPTEFERVHRNRFVSSVNAFVEAAWWDACKDGNIPALSPNTAMIGALDAAVTNDSFGIILISGDDPNLENYYIRYSKRWIPPRHGKLDFSLIEKDINDLLDLYNIIELAYDPYQLEDMAGRINRSLKTHAYAFNQGSPRLIADKQLFDKIRDRKIHHDGNLDLREHVLNANAKQEGDKMRIIKRAEHLKIDLCVATSMALARAVFWRI